MNSENPSDPNAPGSSGSSSFGSSASSVIPRDTQESAKADLNEAKNQAQHDLSAAKDQAQHDLAAIKDKAAADVRDLKHQAADQIGAGVEQAKGFANEQKDFAAGQLQGIASAVTKVADELDGSDQAAIGRYARDIAGGVERFADNVRTKNVDELLGMAQQFGRSQPLAFLGAAALVGFVASRFALASSHTASTSSAAGNTAYRGSSVSGNGTSYGSAGSSSGSSSYAATGTSSATGSTYGNQAGGGNYGRQQ